ncbi:MAG: hypothetical protein ACRDI2_10570, partial [Chloroflexota bacterium]
MLSWIGRYGGYLLVAAGWLLVCSLIPSAAGPADALRGPRVAAPGAPGSLPAGAPLSAAALRLIGSPRHDRPAGPASRATPATSHLVATPTVLAPDVLA